MKVKPFFISPHNQMTSNLIKKLLRVALIGCPNAGKSTLLNKLIGVEVSSVSKKVHTTRRNLLGVSTEDDTQIEYYDTPGIVDRQHMYKHKLENSMFEEPRLAGDKCDLIAVIVDAYNKREQRRINKGVLQVLHDHQDKQSILILNKVDLIKDKRMLLDIGVTLTSKTRDRKKSFDLDTTLDDKFSHTGYSNFSQIFSISALEDDGIDELKHYLISVAVPVEQWPHGPEFLTNQNTVQLVNEIVRGRVLDYVDHEIPYLLKYKYRRCTYDDSGSLIINLSLICPKRYMVAKVLGERGVNIFRIVEDSRDSIANVLKCDVKLSIVVEPPN